METSDDLESSLVERAVVDRIWETTEQGSPQIRMDDWKRLCVVEDKRDEFFEALLEVLSESRSLPVVPLVGDLDIRSRCGTKNELHRLFGLAASFADLDPRDTMGIWVSEAPVEFFSMPLGYRDRVGLGCNAIPHVGKQLEALFRRKAEDLIAERV